ncbi:MAG: M14 family metallopeptidase [Puniceicoccales bacterium]
MSYEGEVIDVELLGRSFVREAKAMGFTVETLGEDRGLPVLALTRESLTAGAPRIHLSAGIHGDEPAGPVAILNMLRGDALSQDISWCLLPMLCPDNLRRNDRLGEGGVDPNRDYRARKLATTRMHCDWLEGTVGRFDLAFCLHEDYDTRGFYLYEHLAPGWERLSAPMITAVSAIAAVEQASEIDGFAFEGGVHFFDETSLGGREHEGWAEALMLVEMGTHAAYTLETPSNALSLGERGAIHAAAVLAGVGAWMKLR